MKKRWICLFVMISLCLSGCSSSNPYDVSKDVFYFEDEHITAGIVNTLFYYFEKCQNDLNEPVFGKGFWDEKCFSNPDMTFSEYEKEYVFYENVINMYCLSSLWLENNVLSEAELKRIREAAIKCYDALSEDTHQLLEVSAGELESIFTTSYTATLMKTYISETADSLISEEETRVISVLQLDFSKRDAAKEIISLLDTGADVYSVEDRADSFKSINMSRDDCREELQNVLFSLRTGEHSDIVENNGLYSVYVMLESYQKDLSDARKEQLLDKRFKDELKNTCDNFLSNKDIYINKDLWDLYVLKSEELPDELYDIGTYLKDLN